MRRPLVTATALAALLSLGGCAALAQSLVDGELSRLRAAAALETRSTAVGPHLLVTLERRGDPTLVFLHGYSGSKDNWLWLVPHLPESWGVVAVDFAGHGDSSQPMDARYTLQNQRDWLATLLDERVEGRFHLVGNSMGGLIATLYAAEHQERLLSLTLVDAAGVRSAHKTPAWRAFERGENPYRVESVEDFDRFLHLVMKNPPAYPGVAKEHFARRAVEGRPFLEKMRADMASEIVFTEELLPGIRTPSLVLWGDSDAVLHPAMADVFCEGLPDCRKLVIADAGHVPFMERPAEVAEPLVDFVRSVDRCAR
jgi:pimeloyl-ACP methyl ester carboxylesterase